MPAGRPIVWTHKKKVQLLADFLKYIELNDIPIIAEFAYQHGVARQKLYEFEELNDALKLCTTKKEAALETKALTHEINTTMAIFSLKQLGWSDKQDISVNGDMKIVFDPILEKEFGK